MKRQEHIKKQIFLIHSELTDKVAWDGHKKRLKKKKKEKRKNRQVLIFKK